MSEMTGIDVLETLWEDAEDQEIFELCGESLEGHFGMDPEEMGGSRTGAGRWEDDWQEQQDTEKVGCTVEEIKEGSSMEDIMTD